MNGGPCLCGDPYCRRCFPNGGEEMDYDDTIDPPPDEPREYDDEDEDPDKDARERAEDEHDRSE